MTYIKYLWQEYTLLHHLTTNFTTDQRNISSSDSSDGDILIKPPVKTRYPRRKRRALAYLNDYGLENHHGFVFS